MVCRLVVGRLVRRLVGSYLFRWLIHCCEGIVRCRRYRRGNRREHGDGHGRRRHGRGVGVDVGVGVSVGSNVVRARVGLSGFLAAVVLPNA